MKILIFFNKLFDPLVKNETKNWYEAEAYCKAIGGSLASFKSFNGYYNFRIGQQLSLKGDRAFWIGLNILDKDKGYQWSDESPVSYQNWAFGQPDNHNGAENCVETRAAGTWYDSNCYASKGYVCKIAKGVNPNLNVQDIVTQNFTGN